MFLLLVALALIVATEFSSHAGARLPAKSGSAGARVVTVVIRNVEFEPASVTVHPGDTVEWKNEGIVPHSATADGILKPAFDSGIIQMGATWRYVARKKGTYNYACTLHPDMKGELIVQ